MTNLPAKEAFQIVSCSFSVPLKRVELIAQALKEIEDFEVAWTHIGSGRSQPFFEKEIEQNLGTKTNIKFALKGEFSNEEVLRFYQENHFDLFINTSEFEGIPIGMMEAMSFGIPCIGTNTGGVSEIIEDGKTGFLLPQYPKPNEIAEKIEIFYSLTESQKAEFRSSARNIWEEKFDAAKNYPAFIKDIFALTEV